MWYALQNLLAEPVARWTYHFDVKAVPFGGGGLE